MLKLEVGKVYVNDRDYLYEILFFDNKNKYFYGRGIKDTSRAFIYTEDGKCIGAGFDLKEELKEHYVKTSEFWTVYDDTLKHDQCWLDRLTGKFTSGSIHENKNDAQAVMDYRFNKILKVKVIAEDD